MKHRLFTQLLCVFLAVILLSVGVSYSLIYFHMRASRIEARVETLKSQANDVAWLAGNLLQEESLLRFGSDSVLREALYQKTGQIYSQYNAFTVIMTRSGRLYSYYSESALQDESLQHIPSAEELAGYMTRALQGEEIAVQTSSSSGPLFTVILPWTHVSVRTGSSTVMGIVMIQTAAQNIRATYSDLIWQLGIGALCVLMAAVALTFFLTRRLTKPLTAMEQAASALAQGDFTARAPEDNTSREIRSLAAAFNRMAGQLDGMEQSRRDFVANVSHELRSPVTSIQGFAQGILDGTVKEEDRAKYLSVIVDETHRLSRLIANLLNLSRMENDQVALALSDFDVNELVRRVLIARISAIEEKNLEIEPDFEAETCPVRADREQIQQVILNLLDNAVKYTPEGGKIRIATVTRGDTVYLTVRDNGIGILPEDAEHIFDRFYKADKAHTVGKGTGLGLAICKIIMEKHGQSIRLVSGQGGCEFEITLKKSELRLPEKAADSSEEA